MPTLFLARTVAATMVLVVMSCGQAPSPEERIEADNIRATEQARLAALVAGDAATAGAFHADEFQLVNPVGAVLTKAEYMGAVSSGQVDYIVWQPGEISVRQAGRQAVIRYRSDLEVTVDGRALPRTPHWHIDVYERRDGRWQVVWSQATRVA